MWQMYNEAVHDKDKELCFPMFVSLAAKAGTTMSNNVYGSELLTIC